MSINQHITVPQALMGVIVTIFMSVGTSYVALREDNVRQSVMIEEHERKIIKIEKRQDITDVRYLEILTKLNEIQLQLKDKQDRK